MVLSQNRKARVGYSRYLSNAELSVVSMSIVCIYSSWRLSTWTTLIIVFKSTNVINCLAVNLRFRPLTFTSKNKFRMLTLLLAILFMTRKLFELRAEQHSKTIKWRWLFQEQKESWGWKTDRVHSFQVTVGNEILHGTVQGLLAYCYRFQLSLITCSKYLKTNLGNERDQDWFHFPYPAIL